MPTPTSRELLIRNAISVSESAEALLMMGKAFLNEQPQMAANYLIGAAILCPFSIELLLKSIHSCLNSNANFPSGHNLEKLFNGLPDQGTKTILTNLYDAKTGNKLEDFLLHNQSAFQNWRYFSEQNQNSNIHINYDDARILIEILKNKVLSILNSDLYKN